MDWTYFFKTIQRTIKSDLIPYVTRLSLQKFKSDSDRAYCILVATIISLRTRDVTTEQASEALFRLAKSPQQMLKLTEDKIAKAIYPCGFYKTKAKQILKFSEAIQNQFNGKTPDTLEDLLGLAGVGRKTANLVLTEGYGRHGICVDVHVHRILNRVGVLQTETPDETELRLREILPKRYWKTINRDLVMFGQYHCKPVKPDCALCSLKPECQYAGK